MIEATQRGRAAVKVGLPKGSGEYTGGTPVIVVGIAHEFGVPDLNIPMRSFLRSAIAENDDEIRTLLRFVSREAIEGEASQRVALEKLGTFAASKVVSKIIEGPFTPLAPQTIARRTKKSSVPLNDTGLLKQSITHQVIE